MKNKIMIAALALMCSAGSMQASAASKSANSTLTEVRAKAIDQRVVEIKSMDLTHLSSMERKNLRHELKDMKNELKQNAPNYVYISTGTLILIIILLIILL